MIDYKELNVNPKHRKTGDCSTRALVGVLGITYEEALQLQTKWALKTYYDPTSKQVIEKVLNEFGYIKMKQPRKLNGKKYMVKERKGILIKQFMRFTQIVFFQHFLCHLEHRRAYEFIIHYSNTFAFSDSFLCQFYHFFSPFHFFRRG